MTDDEIMRKLESFVEELNNALKECKDGILTESEAKRGIKEIKSEVKKILPENSRQWKIFDRDTGPKFISTWWMKGNAKYVEKEDCKKLEQLITAIREVLKIYQPGFVHGEQSKTEFYFSKGESYTAKTKVLDIMGRSKESLIIMDAYAGQDNEILKYIDSIKQLKKNLKVQILTEKATPMFKELCNDLVRERGNIEAKRIENVLHGRYLIIDHSEIWELGASVNGIGKKDFSMKKLVDKNTKSKIIKDFNEYWMEAKSIDDKSD